VTLIQENTQMPNELHEQQNDGNGPTASIASQIAQAMAIGDGEALPQPVDPGPRPWPDEEDDA
jgi:hypothetical protein